MSAETSADIVWLVRLVESQAPFSLATTPGGTSSRDFERQDHLASLVPDLYFGACVQASCGGITRMHQQPRRAFANPSVEVIRLSEAGEISISG